MRIRSRQQHLSLPTLLALVASSWPLHPPQFLSAQVPRVWGTVTTGYGWSVSGNGVVGTNSATLAVRIRDSAAVGLTIMDSYIPNGTDSLTHPARSIGGFVASLLFVVGRDSNSLGDRLGQTGSVGIGAFNNLTGVDTSGLRPGVQLGWELPMLHMPGLWDGDMAGNFAMWAIPEPHGRLELTFAFGLDYRIF